MTWKACTKCGIEQPPDRFSPAKNAKDGLNSWCKACKARREKERRAENPEKFREKDRERYIRTGRREYAQKWRKENPERNRQRSREHYWANRDKKIAYMRETKLWRWGGRDDATVEYVRTVLGDPCAYCGSPDAELDHIIPRAAGGEDHWENMTPACRSCNSRKTDRPLLVFLAYRNGCYEFRRDVGPDLAEAA